MFGDGFVQPQQFLGMWIKATEDQVARMDAMNAEFAKLQGQALERAQEAALETTKLMKQTLEYSNALAAEWRKITLDATKKAADFGAKA